jgi:uncharacterized protein YcbX
VTRRLARICRHPIKAIGVETLTDVTLEPGAAVPFDRHWAVAHDAARLGRRAGWAPKINFLRGVSGPELMAITARLGPDGGVTLHHPRAGEIRVNPDLAADADRLIAWLAPLWPDDRPKPAQVLRADGFAMTDKAEPFVSILNLASNRALAAQMGRDLSIHRWRGNLWIDGLDSWQEFDMVGREIGIGPARLRVDQRITRCKATTVNPETGQVDADTLAALREGQGHQDFGVYATVISGGRVTLGDTVTI